MRGGTLPRNILASANRRLLETFAWANGTLAPTVGVPDEAVMSESTRAGLQNGELA